MVWEGLISVDWRGSLLAARFTSQQQASVSHGRICSDSFTCCHTEIEVADQSFYFTQPQYTDTGPTGPSADPITPGAWDGQSPGNRMRLQVTNTQLVLFPNRSTVFTPLLIVSTALYRLFPNLSTVFTPLLIVSTALYRLFPNRSTVFTPLLIVSTALYRLFPNLSTVFTPLLIVSTALYRLFPNLSTVSAPSADCFHSSPLIVSNYLY